MATKSMMSRPDEPKLTMVLPTYNERDNISPLIEALLRPPLAEVAEVLVVDDDSPDGTWQVVADLAQREERVRLLRRTDRRGLTSAIADGVAAARGSVVGWMDCDFSMPPEHVPALLRALDGADVAIGSRYRDGGKDRRDSRTAVILSRIINAYAGLVLGRAIGDYTTGFVVARKGVVEQIGLRGDYGEYCIDFLHRARRAGFRICEVGYVCVPRQRGTSKTGTNLCQFARRGLKYLLTVLQLRLSADGDAATKRGVMSMIEEAKLDISELGDRAAIIPGRDPHLQVQISTIPSSEVGMQRRIIPVCEPLLGGREIEYVTDCVRSNWISSAGKYITMFEEAFARCCGTRYGVTCTSGTTALHLALATLGVGPDDEVIVPTFTMIATANAVTYCGARPVFVDSEAETWNMDPARIEEKITPRTKVIMPIHTYGHPADMDAINEIARRRGLYVVEDAAEAHGAEYKGRRCGSISDVGCFSFYANKIITTGEGGMLTTNNPEIARIARNLRDHAFSDERHFWHKYLGYNYRMTNMQAAIGLAQTERFEELVAMRRRNAQLYNALLKDIPGLTLPPEKPWAKSVYWMYSILVEDEFGMSRDELRNRLAEFGVETRTFFIPIHLQPIYYRQHGHERFPVAEELCRKGLYLPSASGLTKGEIEFVVGCVADIRGRVRHGA